MDGDGMSDGGFAGSDGIDANAGDMSGQEGAFSGDFGGISGVDSALSNALSGIDAGDFNDTGFDDSAMGQAMAEALSQAPEDNGFLGKFKGFLTSQALGKGMNALGLTGPIGQGVLGMAQSAHNGSPAAAFNGAFNGLANMATMGGFGVANGLGVFNGATNGPDNASNNASGNPTAPMGVRNGDGNTSANGGGMWNDVLGGLAGLYMGNRASGQYNQALGSLNDLFSPNGVYAQQMRQQLERRDAAGGRRSQYGPREAQLMAALAQQQAQTLSSPGYANMMAQRGKAQNQGLNTLLTLMNRSGGMGRIGNGIQGMMQGGGLESLMNNGNSSNWALGPNAGPQMPDAGGFDLGGNNLNYDDTSGYGNSFDLFGG